MTNASQIRYDAFAVALGTECVTGGSRGGGLTIFRIRVCPQMLIPRVLEPSLCQYFRLLVAAEGVKSMLSGQSIKSEEADPYQFQGP